MYFRECFPSILVSKFANNSGMVLFICLLYIFYNLSKNSRGLLLRFCYISFDQGVICIGIFFDFKSILFATRHKKEP